MEEGDNHKGIVCVTGGTGFIASWLIMRLLQHGYKVRTTIRDSKKDISFLTNLPGASEKLQVIEADLNRSDSFKPAIEGCTCVFHVAHPMDFREEESEEVLTNRAVQATLGILRICLDSKTVKRVVYTSGAATVMFNHKDQGITDESTWSDIDFYKSCNYMPSSSILLSKMKTERAALEFAEENGMDLVTLNPPLVLGPFICPKLPGSVYIGMAMIFGKQEMYKLLINSTLVHVDDVASAHIFLLEHPNAKGRYICSSNEISMHGLSEFLSAKYPDLKIPKADILDKVEGYKTPSLSSKKLLDSGFKFKHGLDEMFDGAIQCCKEKGFL